MAQRSLYDLINGEFASGNPSLGEDVANPDAVVARQRFVYHFTGKSLDTNIWTGRTIDGGTGSYTMGNNGLEFKTSSSSGESQYGVDFNNYRQYDITSCVMVGSLSCPNAHATNSRVYGGVGNDVTVWDQPDHMAFKQDGGAYFGFDVQNSPAYTFASSGVPKTTIPVTFKIEGGVSTQKLSINGMLAVTTTVSLTSTKVCPYFKNYKPSGTTDLVKGVIKYCEVYNI